MVFIAKITANWKKGLKKNQGKKING